MSGPLPLIYASGLFAVYSHSQVLTHTMLQEEECKISQAISDAFMVFHVCFAIHLTIPFHCSLQCPNPSISRTAAFRQPHSPSNSCNVPSASLSCIPSSHHRQRDNQAIQTQNFRKYQDQHHTDKESWLLCHPSHPSIADDTDRETCSHARKSDRKASAKLNK